MMFQITWVTCVVPFLYQLCIDDQFDKGVYIYTDSRGHRRLLSVDVAATLQKITRPGLISESDWRRINHDMAESLTLKITQATPTPLQKEHLLALTCSIAFNALLIESNSAPPCPYDMSQNMISGLTRLILEQPTSSTHQNTSRLFFACIIRYLHNQSAENDVSLIMRWINEYPSLRENSLFQNTLETALPRLFDIATASRLLKALLSNPTERP